MNARLHGLRCVMLFSISDSSAEDKTIEQPVYSVGEYSGNNDTMLYLFLVVLGFERSSRRDTLNSDILKIVELLPW